MTIALYPLSAVAGAGLALHGYRKGSLSPSGAAVAFLVGYLSLGNPLRHFGVLLLVFYFTGSRATKVKASIKAQLEHEAGGHKASAGGGRDAVQVACNALTGTFAALLYRCGYGDEKTMCLIALGHYACCMGDTLASELGILAKGQPRLVISPARKVPPGTNGGVSALGTAVSALGGTLIGLAAIAANWHAWENKAKIVLLGTFAGFFGSMLDSVLGATMQQTLYSPSRKQILIGRRPSGKDQDWQVVTGADILSNNQVNFISSLTTALLTAYLGM